MSTTVIFLSNLDAVCFWQIVVTLDWLWFALKTLSPKIVFPVELFPFPVFPCQILLDFFLLNFIEPNLATFSSGFKIHLANYFKVQRKSVFILFSVQGKC